MKFLIKIKYSKGLYNNIEKRKFLNKINNLNFLILILFKYISKILKLLSITKLFNQALSSYNF